MYCGIYIMTTVVAIIYIHSIFSVLSAIVYKIFIQIINTCFSDEKEHTTLHISREISRIFLFLTHCFMSKNATIASRNFRWTSPFMEETLRDKHKEMEMRFILLRSGLNIATLANPDECVP